MRPLAGAGGRVQMVRGWPGAETNMETHSWHGMPRRTRQEAAGWRGAATDGCRYIESWCTDIDSPDDMKDESQGLGGGGGG